MNRNILRSVGKGELLANLRKAAKKADKIYLATDPDREGEAISWHLMQALKEDPKKMRRITFNEITKTAVKNSIKQPRDLDMNLVDAQQAQKNAGPNGRLQHQSASLGKGQERFKCRACTVCSTSDHLRQRG